MSDLLNSASLVMIPSGYKEDTVFSAIPTDGSGDLSFTRASNGTRVNSAGLVEVTPWNLVEQSESIGTSPWNVSGYALTSNATTAPNGTNTAELFTLNNGNVAGASYSINQGLPISGAITISVYFKNNNSTGKYVLQTGSAQGSDINVVTLAITNFGTGCIGSVESVGNGWYRFSTFIPSASSQYFFSYQDGMTGDGSKGIYLWGAQINYGALKPYFPTTDRLNVPRLTYQNGGGGCPSLLLEKQSTNLVTYSNDATQQGFSNMSATANTTTSPDGTQNADTITPSAGTSDHYLITSGASVSSGVIFTASVFVKKKDSDYLYFGTGGAAAWGSVAYRFSTNTFFNVGGGVTSYNATDMGNGWIRLTNTGTTGGTDLRILLTPSDSSGARTFNANGTDGLYIWGLQIEQSSYVTSAIETTSASATRVADACFKTGISSLIGQTEGVLFADFVCNGFENYGTPLSVNDGSISNYVWLTIFANGNLRAEVYNGAEQASITYSGGVVGQRYKLAFAYKTNDFAMYVNGSLVGTDVSGTTFSGTTLSRVDFNLTNNALYGKQLLQINQAILFPTRLTNAELASLTTI